MDGDSPLLDVAPNTALKLRAMRDFSNGIFDRFAGDEWLFIGPGTYTPRVEVQVVEIVRAIVIKPLQALRLRAKKDLVDSIEMVTRNAGDEYLVKRAGAFIPQVQEEVVETVSAYVLTDKKALHLQALRTFVDAFGITRQAGQEYLVTSGDTEAHIPGVNEKLIGEVSITTLTAGQYCVVLDPVGLDGKPQVGKRIERKGPISFFLQPGERLEAGIQTIHVLDAEEALLLRAREAFKDQDNNLRKPGDRWMIYGPCDYVLPVEVDVVEKRRSIPLDENEGIYVRDIKYGCVRMVTSRSYMLLPGEELWEKELTSVEDFLVRGASGVREGDNPSGPSGRDKTRVVSFRAPHNTAVQIYDYKLKRSRVVYGPELVMLGPDDSIEMVTRNAGDEYLVKTALHLRALRTFVDAFGITRQAGQEYLVTSGDTEAHIPDVNESIIGEVSITTLTAGQYCVVLDPVGLDGKPQVGKRIERKGPISFFLLPGERLEAGIQTIHD